MNNERRKRLGQWPLIAVLVAGAVFTYVWVGRSSNPAPAQVSSSVATMHVYLVDVAGWYQITPNESAVASPFTFNPQGMNALPTHIGGWTGQPRQFGAYEGEVDQWFNNPDVGLSSLYIDAQNRQLWFSVFGSAGSKSYSLFEHTPVTSYPANGWTLLDSSIVPVTIPGGAVTLQRAYLQLNTTHEKRIVYYWYLWPDTARDPAKGVLTMRVHVPVATSVADADQAARDFVRVLFTQSLDWHRF